MLPTVARKREGRGLGTRDSGFGIRLAHRSVAIYSTSGQRLESSQGCIFDRYYVATPVRDLMVLQPGEAREFNLNVPCGGLPRMPAGEYRVHATPNAA